MTETNTTVVDVTERIVQRSRSTRQAYLDKIRRAAPRGPRRFELSCSNRAHAYAACGAQDQSLLRGSGKPNIAIVSAYNDLLSAHQPFAGFPQQIKDTVRAAGGVAQFAGGVPAMCDGVTQGRAGMELSLWSRDVIALATAVTLAHDLFDGAVCLGVCDKIVPGLLIGVLSFGHLPVVFMPAGPMPSGLPNIEKLRIRQRHAEGKVDEDELLEAESASYHASGTCNFYGTANSNQMLMEIMGLHLPGASFVAPGTPLRDALTAAAARRVTEITAAGDDYTPVGEIVDEHAVVNAIVGLLATGGSANHTLHLVAIARTAGVQITWDDFDDLATVVPLVARIFPNGTADVNDFHLAGGMAYLIGELLRAGLLHGDVRTVAGGGLEAYRREAQLIDGKLTWTRFRGSSRDGDILRPVRRPFQHQGGLRRVDGNLGRAVVKVSAVKARYRRVRARAAVFERPEDLRQAFAAGELDRDLVAVVRFQGPQANGMPELHTLMPPLGVLQDRGFKVALVTDGRLAGDSGKVPAAVHVTPEAADGGALAKLEDGDEILLDPESGKLEALVEKRIWRRRKAAAPDLSAAHEGAGRELFTTFRASVTSAEEGAMTFGFTVGDEELEAEFDDENAVLGW